MDIVNNLRNKIVGRGFARGSSEVWVLEKTQKVPYIAKKTHFEYSAKNIKGIEKPVQLRLPLYFNVN